jgi:hypothetical protein
LHSEIEFSCLGAPTTASKALQVSSGAWSKFRAINLEIIVGNCSKLNESARGDHEVIRCKHFIWWNGLHQNFLWTGLSWSKWVWTVQNLSCCYGSLQEGAVAL